MSNGGWQMRFVAVSLCAAAMTLWLGGCASEAPSLPKISELNPFKQKQTPLPGRRIPIVETTESISSNLADANKPIQLPAPRVKGPTGDMQRRIREMRRRAKKKQS